MTRFGALIVCLTAVLAGSACSLIVTADPEGDGAPDDGAPDDGTPDDGAQDPAETQEPGDEAEGMDLQPEDAAGEDAPAEDMPEDAPLPPPGWTECPDEEGGSAWVRLMPASEYHDTWSVVEDDCLRAIGAQALFSFLKASHHYVEGLARIVDESVFGCLEDMVHANHDTCQNPDSDNDTCFYHIGLIQDPGGAEPAGGWHWTGYRDGGGLPENLGSLAADHVAGIADDFDDECCMGDLTDSDCGLLKVVRIADSWSTWFIDFKCIDACVPFQGICMIAFTPSP